jgi:phage/plasmid-like protein (TIGR03299 family)
MAYHGEIPWHGLGVEVPKDVTAREMIVAAGLDWQVAKRPVPGAKPDEKGRPTRFQLVRHGPSEGDREVLLALVTRRYEPLQNCDAFEFFDPVIRDRLATFETAGALGDGERVWVLAQLGNPIRVIGDDIVDRYLLLSNSHSGREAVTVRFTPIRVVCQNTLMLALEDGSRAVRIQHTRNVVRRLAELGELVAQGVAVYERATNLFQALARIDLTQKRLEEFYGRVYPPRPGRGGAVTRPKVWDDLTRLFERHDGIREIAGTLWAAYNAVTRHEDYRSSTEASADRRLHRVWFGSSAETKLLALRAAEDLARRWAN